jgi:hypothetical protein
MKGTFAAILIAVGLAALPRRAEDRLLYVERLGHHFQTYHVRGPMRAYFALRDDPTGNKETRAFIEEREGYYMIFFTPRWFMKLDEEDIMLYVVHELCHAQLDYKVIPVWSTLSVAEVEARHLAVDACIAVHLDAHRRPH